MFAHAKAISNDNAAAASLASWKAIYNLCGAAAWLLLLYSLATMVIVIVVGGQPTSAQEGFTMLQQNRLAGLLRLDVLTLFFIPLYYVLFFGLYKAHQPVNAAFAALAALLVFAGLTLFLATPSVFSWLALSDRFAMATGAAEKSQLLAAGEAILASDMWHGSGPVIGGILLQAGAVLISVVMLGSKTFGKTCAYVGIVSHGLDLLRILILFFSPAGNWLMAIAGPLYLPWFVLIARGFYRAARGVSDPTQKV